uniref:AP-2 complex subunit alpha n=1 Tax=Lygus hesperus TaxID=30085 RepID=A0A0A9ZCE0_LYGHE
MDMRGLAHFIQDIRAATNNKRNERIRVDEELAKIRAKFVNAVCMTVYQRKKYVCKLMFISMLGYRVTFGHMEAVRLMAGNTASEKLIGYLALTVLLDESSELLTLTTHTVYQDLLS